VPCATAGEVQRQQKIAAASAWIADEDEARPEERMRGAEQEA
jgi:hypothetical protein